MLSSIVVASLVSAPAGLLARFRPRHVSGWLLALLPLSLFVLFCAQIPAIATGASLVEVYPWVPRMGVDLAFTLDGLSLLFALLISGIGTLIVIYAGYYLAGDAGLGRFYLYLLMFMGAMLGLVLAGNVLTMFVFWELTSVSSYLLIGYKHDYPETRRGAQQGLLITAGGGLALLVGLLLLGEAAKLAGVPAERAYSFDAIIAAGAAIQQTSLYTPALLLIFLGCFTKSAQFPFHFWLPNAMAAPTPASAFLHSATMVKAGVYLLARLHPGLSGTALWTTTLTAVGAATMLLGAVIALRKFDMKALLAYSTISQLGTLTMLAGLGGADAHKALVTGILAHALYKGALFLLAGIVDHETGTRDLRQLGGLWREMRATAVVTIVAALSMAGIPPLFGFVSKEVLLKGAIYSPLTDAARFAVLAAIVAGAAFGVAYSWRLVRGAFFGPRAADSKYHPHDPALGMLIAPGLLAALSLLLPLALLPLVSDLLVPAAGAVGGKPKEFELALWEGVNLALILSLTAIGAGALLARFERPLAAAPSPLPAWLGADPIYDRVIDGLLSGATALTRMMQNGRLRFYMGISLLTMTLITGVPFALYGLAGLPAPTLADVRAYEVIAALLVPVGVLAAIRARSRLGAIIAVSMVGAMVAFFFVLYSAPDLALTQLLIEVLATVFLLLVFSVLPSRFARLATPATRLRNGLFALAVGALMAGLTYAAASSRLFERISPYYMASSLPEGKGANVVNVILVDFRGFDTLGEITVLFIVMLGIYGLLRMRN